MKIVVISDTHMRPGEHLPDDVARLLDGADLILHAGDLVSASLLAELEDFAPVQAVRGNCDRHMQLPLMRRISLPDGGQVQLVHQIDDLGRGDWQSAGPLLVVHGHTHQPEVTQTKEALVVNPGSPFSPRGGHPPSLAWVWWEHGVFRAEIKNLPGDADT